MFIYRKLRINIFNIYNRRLWLCYVLYWKALYVLYHFRALGDTYGFMDGDAPRDCWRDRRWARIVP